MKHPYVISLLLVLSLSPELFAQAPDTLAVEVKRQGVRTSSNIPETELKEIYISTINSQPLSKDQKISYDVINDNFPHMTQALFFKFQENAEGYAGNMDVLWHMKKMWLLPQNFKSHPYYRALYCIYLSRPINQNVRGFHEGSVNAAFVNSLRNFLGCSELAEQLRDQLPEHASLIQNNWDIVSSSK